MYIRYATFNVKHEIINKYSQNIEELSLLTSFHNSRQESMLNKYNIDSKFNIAATTNYSS